MTAKYTYKNINYMDAKWGWAEMSDLVFLFIHCRHPPIFLFQSMFGIKNYVLHKIFLLKSDVAHQDLKCHDIVEERNFWYNIYADICVAEWG